MKKHKFSGFSIWEKSERKDLSFEEIEAFEKQGYAIEIKLVRPEDVKIISMDFETIEEAKKWQKEDW